VQPLVSKEDSRKYYNRCSHLHSLMLKQMKYHKIEKDPKDFRSWLMGRHKMDPRRMEMDFHRMEMGFRSQLKELVGMVTRMSFVGMRMLEQSSRKLVWNKMVVGVLELHILLGFELER